MIVLLRVSTPTSRESRRRLEDLQGRCRAHASDWRGALRPPPSRCSRFVERAVGSWSRGRSSVEQMLVAARLVLGPRVVVVAEVDALAEKRVIGAPELVEEAATRDAQVLFLESDEGGGARVVVLRDLEAEAVGFVLLPARVAGPDGRDHERDHTDQDQQERNGRDVRQLGEAESLAPTRDDPRLQ